MERAACTGNLFQDVARLRGPNEGLWVLVVAIDVIADHHDELFEVVEYAAPDAVFGQFAEEAFDHVQP